MEVASAATNTLTVTRGAESTTGATHDNATIVEMLITAEAITDLNTAVNDIENDYVNYTGTPADGDIIRYNNSTGHWESCSEPFTFTQINLSPRSTYVTDIEGGMYYDSEDNSVYVGTE